MRTITIALVLLFCLSCFLVRGELIGETVVDPESEAREAIRFLESVSEDSRIYIRLLSTYDIPEKERKEFEVLQRVNLLHQTLSPSRNLTPKRVSPTLWYVDLRSYGWNEAAWRAVALRDKAFREPWVTSRTAQRLRVLLGEDQPTNFHVIGVISGFGLYRRTYQTVETTDHYDLIFAEQRFPIVPGELSQRLAVQYWQGGQSKTDGKPYPAGWYEYGLALPKRSFVDFPKDQNDWIGAFLGGETAEQRDKALKNLRSRRGAAIKGMEEVKPGEVCSFVAKNNRLIWMEPAQSRIGAIAGQTFDVKKSGGKRDLEENAFTDQERDKGRVFRDGGELLFTLPNGCGVDTLLINGQTKRVEEVPPDIAIHTRDPRDRRVRNGPMACYACHAEAYCWIPLANTIERDSPDEVDVRFKNLKTGLKDLQAAEDYDSFFIGWQDDIKPARESVKSTWGKLTGSEKFGYMDSWTGLKLGQVSLKWKHLYDDPVDTETAVRETGAPEPFLRVAASRAILKRTTDIARKQPVPRQIWDEDVFPELMKLLSSSKERVTP